MDGATLPDQSTPGKGWAIVNKEPVELADAREYSSLVKAGVAGFFFTVYLTFLFCLCFAPNKATLFLLAKILVLSSFVSFSPAVAARIAAGRFHALGLQSGLLSLIVVAVLALFGVLQRLSGIPLLPVVGLMGVLALAVVIRFVRLKRSDFAITPLAYVSFAALGLFVAAVSWDDSNVPADAIVAVNNGQVHLDYVFHAALCGMIRTHGIPSGGLHGVAFHPYHWGSHWVIAQLVELLDGWCTDGFSLVFPILFSGQLVTALLVVAARIRIWYFGDLPPGESYGLLFGLCLVSGGLPGRAFTRGAVWPDNVLLSQSYLLSTIALLFSLAAAIEVARSGSTRLKSVFIAPVLPLLVGLVGLLKISAAVIAGIVICVLGAACRLDRHKRTVPALVSLCAVLLVLKFTALQAGDSISVAPFDYIKRYTAGPFNYLGRHFFYLWLLLIWGVTQWFRSDSNRRRRAGLIVMTVTMVALIGGTLPNLIRIRDGSGFYFSDPHRVLAIAALAAVIVGRNGYTRALMFIAAAIVVSSTYENIRVRARSETVRNIYEYRDTELEPQFRAAVSRVLDLRQLTLNERRLGCIFMPHDVHFFWSGFFERPDAALYVIPALSEMYMIRGIPSSLAADARWTSFDGYSLKATQAINLDGGGEQVLTKVLAEARGMRCERLYQFDPGAIAWIVHRL